MNDKFEDLDIIGKRMAHYLSSINVGTNEAGRRTGTSGSQVSNILNGKNYGVDKLLLIFKTFPDLNPIWLLKGTGDMLLSQECTTDQERTDRLRALEAQPPAHARGADALTREKIGRLEDKIKSMERENALLREMIDVLKATQ